MVCSFFLSPSHLVDLPRPQSDQVTAVITACCTKLLQKGYVIKHEPGVYSRNENYSYGIPPSFPISHAGSMELLSDDASETSDSKKESKKAKTESKKDKTKSDSPPSSSDGRKSTKAPKTPPGSGTIGNAILQVIPTKPTPITELLRLLKEHGSSSSIFKLKIFSQFDYFEISFADFSNFCERNFNKFTPFNMNSS